MLTLFISGYDVTPAFSQNHVNNSLLQSDYPYAFEEEWIEVMFSAESKVRMRNGNLTDLKTQALQGVDQVLSGLSWHQWHRLTDIAESTIDNWEINGERNTGKDIYNLNNIYRLKIPAGHDTWNLAERLEALPGIYLARPVPKPMVLPNPPNYQSQQGYLNPATPAPAGVDALYAWTQPGGTGTGVTICDLEYSWNYNHADVTKALGSQINTNVADPFGDNNHGTAVIGEIVSDNNGWGTTGICYGSNLKTCGTYYGLPTPVWNVPGALAVAIANLNAGDIILIEQQWDYTGGGGYVPIEWWTNYSPNAQTNNAVYSAIVTAIANGIHVVEAGGNGNINTGAMTWYGNSGAVIVGAGGAYTGGVYPEGNLQRLSFSSYGPRFDMQGWGENVFTTGYGTYYNLEGVNYYYRADFNGTSSASPIVAGAFACAEGYYLANISTTPPTPAYLLTHMVTWGTAQITPPAGNIGPRPNLAAAIPNFPLATMDFGDAPDGPYPTLLISNGARHTNTGLRLGMLIDSEMDGQPNGAATGDDINPLAADDEDGVTFTSTITQGQLATVQVIANAPGMLNAWVDFNMINAWGDVGEFVIQNAALNPGINNLSFMVPANAIPGPSYARFRFNAAGGIPYFGQAPDGEVEDYQVFIEEAPEIDWGDAPDFPYPTLNINFGANHTMDGLTFLGTQVDGEPDGQPEPMAMGDDLDIFYPPPNDDEDGVMFLNPFIPNQMTNINVIASVQGFLNVWIDYNANGSWAEAGDWVFMDVMLTPGLNALALLVPPNAATGPTFARFRFSTMQGLGFMGGAPNGEVEDYSIIIEPPPDEYDWGDAPDPIYPTLSASLGASHKIVAGFFLGMLVDAEPDGQPDPNALGDDNNPAGSDDEDGVWWPCNFVPGHTNTVKITASAPGLLNAWFDFNSDGDWADTGEQVFTDLPIPAGVTDLNVTVPTTATVGVTFTRFRFSTQSGLSYTGPAQDGEVEDHLIMINPEEQMDYGDVPDPTYPTLAISNGARHVNDPIIPIFLGNMIDWELDGQPSANADGDDLNPAGGIDDEDGVILNTPWIPGMPAMITVTASIGGGAFQGWVDFNNDGDFMDPLEQIFNNTVLVAGPQPLNFNVPPNALLGNTYSRFRYSTMPNLMPYGCAPNGEVEDYKVLIGQPNEYDWGDLPDPAYPTLSVNNGPNHITGALFLGNLIDSENDGQPHLSALGDDMNNLDDEDGVAFTGNMIPGQVANVTVTASQGGGLLQGWMDMNADGDFNDPGEQIFTNQVLAAGDNLLTFAVNPLAKLGGTFARFRLSTFQNLGYTGGAPDGEVEDYKVYIVNPGEGKMHWDQLPDLEPTGMDVDITWVPTADDFLCTETGPVNRIRMWVSFADDLLPLVLNDDTVRLQFYTDIPAGMDTPWSMPGTLLWSKTWYAGEYVANIISTNAPEWWYDPATQWWEPNNHQIVVQFDFDLGSQPFYQTMGQIYWLEAKYLYSDPPVLNNTLGWKTTKYTLRFNDDAVWWNDSNPNFPYGWVAHVYPGDPNPHPYAGQSFDMSFIINPPIEMLDYGDCPEIGTSFPTRLINNGARHQPDGITYLGPLIDSEADGFPTLNADGDDMNITDDEDGVVFMWPLAAGNPCKLKVNASVGNALFNGWIDFNGNGSWAEPNEHVFTDLNLLAGDNYLTFITPQTADTGITYARFRFSHQPALSYTGAATDGEVEDYAVQLIEYSDLKWQQLPDTLLPGLHVNETNILADDWICNGGVVTDIHWWGNYEMLGGLERRGQGINHFLVHIYSDANCLPNSIVRSYVVPFSPAIEIYTGQTNNEGSPIYKYDYMLPVPFIQVKNTTYWLTIQAISNNPNNPPFWRWQEANRWLFPIHCGAAQNTGPGWQTITWPFPPLIKYTDFAFRITSWVLDTLYLQNMDVTSGQDNCYDANMVIVVAGSGTTFTVQSGGRATMIAGQKISYLPTTQVFPGGYMHGYITTTGQYCSSLKTTIVSSTINDEAMDPEIPELVTTGSFFRIYPNPTTGTLTLEVSETGEISVEIYGMFGKKVLAEKVYGQNKYEFSLALQPSGVYIMRVISGNEAGTVKVIKR